MNTSKTKASSLTKKILIGMFLGILAGFIIRNIFSDFQVVNEYIVNGLFNIGGAIFVASLKMLVVPLVFVSLVCGTSNLKDIKSLGRLGSKTLLLYILTTAVAITIALLMAIIFKPGVGADLKSSSVFKSEAAPGLGEVFINMFPTNPINAMAQGNTLQIIVFAILFGIAVSAAGNHGERARSAFEDLNEIIMKLVTILMLVAPYGVFFLMAKLFSTIGLNAIYNLIGYFLLVAITLIIHALLTYSIILKSFTGLSPITFFKKMEDALLFAFSTSSSNATLPVTMETTTHRMGASNKVASFTVPLGATINMDGTAIMQGVATVFISQAFNIDLSLTDYLMVIVTATLASIGTAGVPGVGLIMLAMVLNQVGLPVEGIALIMGVDRLLDMMRTAVNITGDSVVTCIVAKSENQLDLDKFKDPNAGSEDEEIHLHD